MKRYHNERIIHNVRDGDVPRLLEDRNPGKARPKSWQTRVQSLDIHPARALRWLLLADGAFTVGREKTFWCMKIGFFGQILTFLAKY